MPANFLLDELNCAIAADCAAKSEAMRRGLMATQPLTVTRLGELVKLGEKMMETKERKDKAVAAVHAWTLGKRDDLLLTC